MLSSKTNERQEMRQVGCEQNMRNYFRNVFSITCVIPNAKNTIPLAEKKLKTERQIAITFLQKHSKLVINKHSIKRT